MINRRKFLGLAAFAAFAATPAFAMQGPETDHRGSFGQREI
ncbi:MAG: hypothetical protein ABL936_19755 [Aestuariivirga sp.]